MHACVGLCGRGTALLAGGGRERKTKIERTTQRERNKTFTGTKRAVSNS